MSSAADTPVATDANNSLLNAEGVPNRVFIAAASASALIVCVFHVKDETGVGTLGIAGVVDAGTATNVGNHGRFGTRTEFCHCRHEASNPSAIAFVKAAAVPSNDDCGGCALIDGARLGP